LIVLFDQRLFMELRHLRYFVATAEELHFGRAARRVNVVQPALSQQIRQLERELGVALLTRTRRHVSLTESGRVFLTEARRTLADAERARSAAHRAAAGEVGRLRLGYVDLATWHVLPAILRRHRRRFPGVELTLTELHREPLREALLRGDLDVGFFSLREGDGLEGQRVIDDPLVVALPIGHPLATKRRVPLAALADEPWVLFPRELKSSYVELVLAACVGARFVPRVVQEANQFHTLRALVQAGFGVSLLPSAVVRSRGSGIAVRALRGRAPRLRLDVVWRPENLSPAATQFVTVAREQAMRLTARDNVR
jgi:DNA-binding transcriptional LysR family regulator